MKAANMAAASVAASYADQHPEEEEDYALERCFPETVPAPAESAPAGPEPGSEDILVAASDYLENSGANPAAV
eukprot:10432767-Alexandrium_andersonii.AAC.1